MMKSSTSQINVHLMFLLFTENQKSIPKILVVKIFSKIPDFKFYPSKLNIPYFFVLFIAVKTDSKLTLHYMGKIFII